MKISSITATADKIKIRLSGVEAGIGITVKAFVPLIVGNAKENKMPGRQVVSHTAEAEEVIGLPRFKDGYDLALCRFDVEARGRLLAGVRYVTETCDGYSKSSFAFSSSRATTKRSATPFEIWRAMPRKNGSQRQENTLGMHFSIACSLLLPPHLSHILKRSSILWRRHRSGCEP